MSVLRVILGTYFTSDILSAPTSFSAASLKKDIINLDYSRVLDEASSAPHLKYIVEVDTSQECSWPKIWDLALDRGPSGTSCVLAVLKLLGLPVFRRKLPLWLLRARWRSLRSPLFVGPYGANHVSGRLCASAEE